MGGGGGKQTVGYRYHMGFRVVLGGGPVDSFREIRYDGRVVWAGTLSASGPIDVDLPELMGGEKREGGITGRFSVAFGESTQGVNAYLQAKLGGVVPAFRRRLSVIAEQIYYGTNPYLKTFSWRPQRALSREVRWYDAKADINGHMNAAHMIVDAITSRAFGAGRPVSVIDDASFRAAADTLYTENFGLSLLWTFGSTPDAVPKFIQLVLDHIGGVLFPDPRTGLIRLELLRGGYSVPSLPLFDDSNSTLTDYEDAQIGDTINEVVLTYTDASTGKPRTISAQNIGNVNAQGRVVSAAVDYPGIQDDTLAQKVLDRDLRALSTLRSTALLEINRTGWDLYPGKLIRVSSARLEITEGVFRVVEINEPGIADKPVISVRIVQDVFGLSSGSYTVRQPSLWVDPVDAVADLTAVILQEIPYYHLATNLSAADMAALTPDYGFVQAFAARDSQSWTSFEMHYSPDGTTYGAEPISLGDGTFGPVGQLAAAIGPMTTSVVLASVIDAQLLGVGQYGVLIEGTTEEMVEITGWTPGTTTATLKRSVMDSVPHSFTAAAKLWVTSFPGGVDSTERTDGETAWYKLLPRNRDSLLPLASATGRSITFANRATRPYPPGNVRINTQYFPVALTGNPLITIDWAHRDRLLQTAGLTAWTSGNIGPEPGTTYNLRLYGETDTLLRTETGLTGITYTWSDEEADSGLTVPGSAPPADYTTEVMADSPVAWWRLDEASGTVANDATGTNHGTYAGATLNQTPLIVSGASVRFSGSSSGIAIPDAANLSFLNTAFSLELWVKTTSTATSALVTKEVSGSIVPEYLVLMSANGTVNFVVRSTNADTPNVVATTPLAVNDGVRHHIVAVFVPSGVAKIYVDGVERASVAHSLTTSFNSTAALYLGRRPNGNYLLGNLDEVAFYASALSAARVLAHYNAGAFGVGLDLPRLNSRVRFELESVRGGLVSRQKHNITVDRAGYGYNYGNYYGGI